MRSCPIAYLTFLLAVLSVGLPWSSVPALAAEGTVNAVSYKQIPSGTPMAVRPWDNSDENLELAKEFTAILLKRGFRVAEDAPLVISFSTRDVLGYWSAGQRRHLLELEGHGGRTGGEKARVMLNLYSSQGGVLNKGKEPGNVVPSKYKLEVTLDQRKGERLWQGEATAALLRTDGFSLLRAMLPALLNHMGQTVRRKTVKF
ncbi:MAG: hypothetical protein HOO19_04065 [Rhodospirillaceae bacterium]|jgi:hypothetical protein|nr:hypothetical protein [Rhodospirillaceae bacterium]MBT3885006.1 hypothetical protein [Rhodospirillaceae bacterium]MBT4116253.1 hypothetical protein [Rhodospirillaceae bacterium]MBT4673917.1 hypothetical protein [Rhodospirillaceae bacterium]MBT4748481.1 hypothetical protein [Rhodospirillaceae bacterium]